MSSELKVWEIGIRDVTDHDEWEIYHPRAGTEEKAIAKAEGMSKYWDHEVYMVEGPFEDS